MSLVLSEHERGSGWKEQEHRHQGVLHQTMYDHFSSYTEKRYVGRFLAY